MGKKRILVVDDEKDILEVIRYNLEKEGLLVFSAENGEEALRSIDAHAPDVMVLDVMMPGIDGIEVCRRVRANSKTASLPVIMLTAKTEETDEIIGLKMGADDYIAKPFSPRLLVARVKVALRRNDDSDEPETIRKNGMILDLAGRSLNCAGREVELTFSEFEILKLLMSHPGRVYSRTQIMKATREDEYISTLRAIDVQILNLRKKLGNNADRIKTVRGAGYKFNG